MDAHENERPCIHVTLLKGTNADLYRWVQIGAEEEGVPCRLTDTPGADLVALAYAAAQSSRFGIGVGVSDEMVALHERHMPAARPVMSLKFSGQADYFCRLMGTNAARMVIRKPFRFADDEAADEQNRVKPHPSWQQDGTKRPLPTPTLPTPPDDLALIAKIVLLVMRKLQERET